MNRTEHDLRCSCKEKPLLATYGVDSKRELYIHIKVWKQSRVFGEVLIKSGTVKIHCRECGLWHTIIMKEKTANLKPIDLPGELNQERL